MNEQVHRITQPETSGGLVVPGEFHEILCSKKVIMGAPISFPYPPGLQGLNPVLLDWDDCEVGNTDGD